MKKIFIILPFIFLSCNEVGKINNEKSEQKTLDTINQTKEYQSDIEIFDFKKFWIELGNSIRNNDTNRIKMFIQLPLTVFGRYEAEPQLKIEKDEVIKVMMFALNNGGYYDSDKDESISNKVLLLSNLDEISEYRSSSETQCINDFLFKKTKKGWKLVVLHMNTEKYLKNEK